MIYFSYIQLWATLAILSLGWIYILNINVTK